VGDDGGVHAALFHGAELGSRPQGKSIHGPFRAERINERGFSLALSGHYHRRRIDNATGLVYPGSPEPLSFDEEGDRGPVLVEIREDGSVGCEPLALNAWIARTLSCDLGGATSCTAIADTVRMVAETASAGTDRERLMLRVDLEGEVAPEIAVDTRTLETAAQEACGGAVVRVRDLTRASIDVQAAAQDRTTRGAFTRAALAAIDAAPDPDERALAADVLRYGLQALSGVEVGLR
jgi:DNA repair exonuclease SbcCD nuclease subunit